MMTEFQNMWDGHLEHCTAAKHSIEITNHVERPIHCALYYAGLKTRAVENAEINRMIKFEVIDPAKRSGPLQSSLRQRRTGHFIFFVDYRLLNAVTVRGCEPHSQNVQLHRFFKRCTTVIYYGWQWGYLQNKLDE